MVVKRLALIYTGVCFHHLPNVTASVIQHRIYDNTNETQVHLKVSLSKLLNYKLPNNKYFKKNNNLCKCAKRRTGEFLVQSATKFD